MKGGSNLGGNAGSVLSENQQRIRATGSSHPIFDAADSLTLVHWGFVGFGSGLAPAIGAFLDPTTTLEVDNDRRPQCAYSGPSDAIRPVDR